MMDLEDIVIWIIFASIMGLMYYFHDDRVMSCDEYQTVAQILELRHRNAVILLENGNKMTVNQAALSPGDSFCVKWSKK